MEQIDLPLIAREGLLVDLCNIGPILHFNQIVVFHDASVFAVPDAYSFAFKEKYRAIMWVLGHTARKILTVSEFSKQELSRYLHIPKNRIIPIPEGCDHILKFDIDDSIIKKNNLSNKPFLLFVGSASPHKNLENLIKAIENDPGITLPLIIAGGNFSKVFNDVEIMESDKIIRTGYVTDGELRSLYSHATAFIFPSLYEGFGLPVLEAMACGCPVICSNNTSLPENFGEATLNFDPNNIQEIRERIKILSTSLGLRESYIRRGYHLSNDFTWKRSADSFFNILCEELGLKL